MWEMKSKVFKKTSCFNAALYDKLGMLVPILHRDRDSAGCQFDRFRYREREIRGICDNSLWFNAYALSLSAGYFEVS
jgi:hypothetical protein